jgi:hypothetical protein
MKIWLVTLNDCESSSTVAVCATKEIAERELFKERDKFIKGCEKMQVFCKENGDISGVDDYAKQIKNLSGSDYEAWNNYPHECPSIYEVEFITE